MSTLRVYFLDVGQGDCSLICLPDKTGIVVDCRSGLALSELLGDAGITHLRAVIATHLDSDHIHGLNWLLREYENETASIIKKIDSLWIAPDRSRAEIGSEAFDLLSFAQGRAEKLGIAVKGPVRDGGDLPKPIWRSTAGQDELAVELLLPFWAQNIDSFIRAGPDGNPMSAVIRVRHGQRSVIIGGDAVLGAFESLHESSEGELRAEVFRSPHHAGDIAAQTTTWRSPRDLYSKVNAEVVVHSLGVNGHGHPLPEHISASSNDGRCHVMCTGMTSRCHGDLADQRVDSHAFFDVAYPYHRLLRRGCSKARRPAISCAGTVLVVLEADAIGVYPPQLEHRQLVDLLDSPLCRQL